MYHKKILTSIFAGCLAFISTVHPLSAATSGLYTYTDDGISITINGYDHTATGAVNIPATIIGKPVTRIDDLAFTYCTKITSVTVPEGVIYLGIGAFQDCYLLKTVKLPSSVTEINALTFLQCISLTDVNIPQGVTTIYDHAFWACPKLLEITIPSSVTSIHDDAFLSCSSLISANFLGNAPLMGTEVFLGTPAGFTVYYLKGKTGFTSPIWMGYSAKVLKADTVGLAITGATNNGAIIHFSASTTTGLSVRLQSSTDKQSWLDLPDNNNAKMKESTATPGIYDLDSTFYPPGDTIYFRAVSSSALKGEGYSPPLGPFKLTRADLSIQMKASSTTDPALGAITISGDNLTYTFTAINHGSATARSLIMGIKVPTYIDASTHDKKQFVLTDIPLDSSKHRMISSGGSFKTATSTTAFDGQIIWNAGDLAPGAEFSESFTLHITTKVLAPEDIRVPNDYVVYGSSFQPPYSATGFSSGSPNVSTHVQGPITFTAEAKNTSVAPGGLITYKFKLANLTHAAIAHAVAVVSVPQSTRFAKAYPKPTGGSVAGVTGVASNKYEQVFAAGQSAPQILIDAGALAAAGNVGDYIIINVTFQAQWADPAVVPTIGAFDYFAAFFNGDLFADPNNPSTQITQYDLFLTKFNNAAGTTPSAPGPTDFISFINLTGHEIALSHNDSGDVNVPLIGPLGSQPKLGLSKTISNMDTNTENDGSGLIDTVQPGDTLTFILFAVNSGKSVADEAYVQDGLPDHTTFVIGSEKLLGATVSTITSNLHVVPDGRHLRFEGLTLQPHDGVVIEYTVHVNSGPKAPALGSLILPASVINPETGQAEGGVGASTISSSSTPHTSVGYYSSGAIKVTGTVNFAEPKARVLVPSPVVTANVGNTANALTAIYNTNWNALPLANSADPLSFIPGAERYYVHYENLGNVAVQGVKLDFPLPANTAFYRASFASLASNDIVGTLINAPSGSSVVPPAGPNGGFLATTGLVSFTFSSLQPGDKGDVMVEVIVKSNAVTVKSPLIGEGASPIVIGDASGTHQRQSPFPILKVATASSGLASATSAMSTDVTAAASTAPVPRVGITRLVPNGVRNGDQFQIQIMIFNNGDTIAQNPFLFWTQPAGTKIVKFEFGGGKKQNPPVGDPIHTYTFELASNNGTVNYNGGNGSWSLNPLSTAGVTITLEATGPSGSDINFIDDTHVSAGFMGQVFASSDVTHITDVPPPGLSLAITGAILSQHLVNGANVNVIKLNGDGSYIVAQGGGNIVAQGGGNIVSQGGGNMDAKGGGNITVSGPSSLIPIGGTTGAALAAKAAGIVAQGGGNVIVPEGASVLAANLSGIVIGAAGAGIVAQGGGNIVAQGGGNIVAQGGGNFISHNGSAIVAQGGGNIVAQGGGNIVSQGGGNLAAPVGAAIVTLSNPQILSSLPGSSVSLTSAFGNRIKSDGVNYRPNP